MAVPEREAHSNAAACLDCVLGDFDWSLEYAVASGTIASVDKPLVRPGLYVCKPSSEVEEAGIGRVLPENQMQTSIAEFTRDRLQAVISEMGAIEQGMVLETTRLGNVKARKMAQRSTNAAKAQQEADGIARIAARNLKEVLNSFKDCVQLVQKTKRMLEVDPKCVCVNSESKWERRKELYDAAESVEATMEFLFRNIFQFRNIEASLADASDDLPEHEVEGGELGRYRLQKRAVEDDDLLWCDRVCVLEMHGPAGAMTRRSTASRPPGSSGEQGRRRPSQIGQSRRRASPSAQSRRQEFLRNLNDSGQNETGNPLDLPNAIVEYRRPGPKDQRAPRKNGDWSTSDLNKAIEMIEGGAKILTAARAVNIPVSTVRDHLLGRRKGRKRGRERILNDEEENDLKAFLLKMHNAGQPLTPGQLKMKVAQLTQTRSTTFVDGVPGKSWMKGFRRRHPDLTNLLHFKSRTSNQVQVHRNLQGGIAGTDANVPELTMEGNALELPMEGSVSALPMDENDHGLRLEGNVPEFRMEGSVGAFPVESGGINAPSLGTHAAALDLMIV